MKLGFRDVVKARMGVGMVPDLMAFGILALHNFRPLTGIHADYEKCGRHFLLFEDVENFRSPPSVGAVIEGQGNLVVRGAYLINVIGKRVGLVLLAGEGVGGRVEDEAT